MEKKGHFVRTHYTKIRRFLWDQDPPLSEDENGKKNQEKPETTEIHELPEKRKPIGFGGDDGR